MIWFLLFEIDCFEKNCVCHPDVLWITHSTTATFYSSKPEEKSLTADQKVGASQQATKVCSNIFSLLKTPLWHVYTQQRTLDQHEEHFNYNCISFWLRKQSTYIHSNWKRMLGGQYYSFNIRSHECEKPYAKCNKFLVLA